MQPVQTLMRFEFWLPSIFAFTACRFTFQRRRVLLFACETLLPNCGPLPQRSHLAAMFLVLHYPEENSYASNFPSPTAGQQIPSHPDEYGSGRHEETRTPDLYRVKVAL